ncbi:hypothetical protein BpHYR1_031866, partial [Brachionus plicatilis]
IFLVIFRNNNLSHKKIQGYFEEIIYKKMSFYVISIAIFRQDLLLFMIQMLAKNVSNISKIIFYKGEIKLSCLGLEYNGTQTIPRYEKEKKLENQFPANFGRPFLINSLAFLYLKYLAAVLNRY